MPKTKPTLTPADINLLKSIFLTKQDAKNFVTKNDIKNFVTKNDIKNFATKNDLKGFTTKDDLNAAIDRMLDYNNQHFATKEEVDDIRQLINHLPTKEEFYTRMDKLSAEYTTFTQEKTILMHRFEQLEQKLAAIAN